MVNLPIVSFSNLTEPGIDLVPLGSIIHVQLQTELVIYELINNTGITSVSTIQNAIDNGNIKRIGSTINDTLTNTTNSWSGSYISTNYSTKTYVDTAVAGASKIDDTVTNTTNSWSSSYISTNYSTISYVDTAISNLVLGATIDDTVTNTINTWSSSKIQTSIDSVVRPIERFIATLNQTSFTSAATNNSLVFVQGALQDSNSYNIAGGSITFTSPLDLGMEVIIEV